jgi:hypothetical protein
MRLTVYLANDKRNYEPNKVYEYDEKVGGILTRKKVVVPFVFKTTHSFEVKSRKQADSILSGLFSNKILTKVQLSNQIIL